jgi:hypothetical protein
LECQGVEEVGRNELQWLQLSYGTALLATLLEVGVDMTLGCV